MDTFKIYLDNCCFNRPFDDQQQVRIRIETEAKLFLQQEIEKGNLVMVWSYILDYENAANPFTVRKTSIKKWKRKADEFVSETKDLVKQAKELTDWALKAKDALHISCAIQANCDYFITTDDGIINKSDTISAIRVINPVDFLKIMED